jgi:hypothetical protein
MPSIRKVAYTPVIGAAIAWESLATAAGDQILCPVFMD